MERVAELVHRVENQPTDRAVALYVSQAVNRTFRLPVPVPTLALVERTFATRALLTALHRMPPHVLLVLHPTCAHLYQGADGAIVSVGQRDPLRRPGGLRPNQGERGTDGAAEELTDDFLRGVDNLLGKYRAEHPSPLVLGGAPHLVARFRQLSRNLHRLAGEVPDTQALTALDLAQASSRVVERYLRSRRDEALLNLRALMTSRPHDVALGMAACWGALRERAPSMLLVEESYVSPGQPEDFGSRSPRAGHHPAQPPVHDLVDDLMESVIVRGGQLALVEDGDLADHGRVALISRPGPRPSEPA